MAYLTHLLIIFDVFVLLAVSLDLVVGFTGLMSLAHAVFYGIGGYATALAAARIGALPAALAGATVAAVVSAFITLPAIWVRGIYLLIITIAVQVVFTVMLLNWTDLTGGTAGIPRIPPLSLAGHAVRGAELLAVLTMLAAVCVLILARLVRSPFGRLLQAVRDDETGCLVLGKNVALAKISIFAFSSAIAALAGSAYAHYTSYVDPRSFDINVSMLILLMVMLGGAGTLFGPILGALVLTLLPEALKFLPLPPGAAAPMRQLAYGLMLVLVIFLRPQGLLGKRLGHADVTSS
jgi:branched-chain amino acid transport system permease protein